MSDARPSASPSDGAASAGSRPWYRRIGPGLVTACVVIGPGSLLVSSKLGAMHGYRLSWVVIVTVACMMLYVTLAARLGVVTGRSPADIVTEHAGRWLAVLIGIAVFVVATTFQFGNNLGLSAAVTVFVEDPRRTATVSTIVLVLFNALSLAFLFGFRNVYGALEKLMTLFVAVMLTAFLANLLVARPSVAGIARGLVPGGNVLAEEVIAIVGTTFSLAAAWYQAYLVRQKGWQRENLADGLLDARLAAGVMGVITLMLVWTAATVLHGRLTSEQIADATIGDIAGQLEPLFGRPGQILFCIGLFSAAYSSFLVNSMIGGYVLSDGLGLGARPTDVLPKLFTAAALLIGMGIALAMVHGGDEYRPAAAIVAAQAFTVVLNPLMAGVLLWLTNRRDVMGDHRNGPLLNALAGLAFVLLLVLAVHKAIGLATG